jgi:hypothetical protein
MIYAQLGRGHQPLKRDFKMKNPFAGRSAKRRVKYGYQLSPNGTYTRTK